MANAAYVRVSSADQNEARQKAALEPYQIDEWFCEKISGKNMDRPKLQEMLTWVRKGDTVYVEDFSRLARSTKDLLSIVDFLQKKQVRLVSLKESLDTETASGRMMLTVIGAINEFERQNILERQAEGIAIAKAKGVYKGRQPKEVKNFDRYYKMYQEREIESKAALARKLHISRPTLYRLIREHDEQQTKQDK